MLVTNSCLLFGKIQQSRQNMSIIKPKIKMMGLDLIQRSEGFKGSTLFKIVNGINTQFFENVHSKTEDIAKLNFK
jgi:hypothetical protein